jgi:triacylglycerol lipase
MDDDCKTRYPLVLVPGLLGFICLLGYHYWHGILALLRGHGAQVFAVLVSPVHSSEVRGEQLRQRIEAILGETGASRVNLIGHSQGALTARYVAACYPHSVASVTSVAGPNHGSEVADAQLARAPLGSWRERLYGAWLRLLCWLWAVLEIGYRGPRLPVDTRAAQASLTTAGVAEFNRRYPQGLPQDWGGQGAPEVNGVRYYSWSGTLQAATHRGRNRFDLSHALCRWSARSFVRERGQNDGLVGRFSSHLGQVIRSDYPLDHFDIVNQSQGLLGEDADPLRLFQEHARRLRQAGL